MPGNGSAVAEGGHVERQRGGRREQHRARRDLGAVRAELDAVDGVVVGCGEQVALHRAAEVRRRVLVEPVGREREAGQRAAFDLGAVVALDRVGGRHGRLRVGGVEGVGPVGPRRVRVTAVEPWSGDADQGILVAVAGLDRGVRAPTRGPVGLRRTAPARVAAVVDGVEVTRLGAHQVVGVAEAGGVDLHRPAGHQPRLVLAVVAAERVVGVRGAGPVLVVEGRQVVGRAADGAQVDGEHGGGQRVLGQQGEVVRGRALVGVAAVGDEQPAGRRVERQAVAGVVLLGARQAPDQVDLHPSGPRPRQARQHAGVGVEVEVVALGPGADARVRRHDVDLRVARRARHEEAGHEPAGHPRGERAVVVAVRHRPHDGDGLGRRDRVLVRGGAGHRQDLDRAVLLGDVEASVGPELQGRGRRHARARQQRSAERRVRAAPEQGGGARQRDGQR